jgi:hypothetical protein
MMARIPIAKEARTMNTRLLGTLCIAGSLIAMADGVRRVMLGKPLTPGIQVLDNITAAALVVAAVAGLCGLLALIALRATGNNPIFRLLTYLPAVSYLATIAAGLGLLTGVLTSDSENPVVLLIWLLGDIFGPAAWLLVAILTVAAKTWRGWRRFVPFAFVLVFPLGIVLTEITGLHGTFDIVHFAAPVLLGFAVQSREPAPQLREALA